jgi:hypothetical protein
MFDDDPSKPEYFLWRLIIGGEFQGKGYGRRARRHDSGMDGAVGSGQRGLRRTSRR